MVQARAAIPQRGRDRRAERAGGDPREVEQSRRGRNPVRAPGRTGSSVISGMKNTAIAAPWMIVGISSVREIGVGVEVRAHAQHHARRRRTRAVAKTRGSTLVNVLADQRRKQDRRRRPTGASTMPACVAV